MLLEDLIQYDQVLLKALPPEQRLPMVSDFFRAKGFIDGNAIPFMIKILEERQRKESTFAYPVIFYVAGFF